MEIIYSFQRYSGWYKHNPEYTSIKTKTLRQEHQYTYRRTEKGEITSAEGRKRRRDMAQKIEDYSTDVKRTTCKDMQRKG